MPSIVRRQSDARSHDSGMPNSNHLVVFIRVHSGIEYEENSRVTDMIKPVNIEKTYTRVRTERVQLHCHIPRGPGLPLYPRTNLLISTSGHLVSIMFPSHHVRIHIKLGTAAVSKSQIRP